MKITISGKQGAGKTTLAKMLAKKLRYPVLSIGDLRGEIAKERNLTIDELNEIAKKESWPHKEADKKTIELGKTNDNMIVEGWIAWHFIPDAVHIFLDVDETVGANRIFHDQRSDEKRCNTLEEMKQLLKKRLHLTSQQFKRYYGVDFLEKKNYTIILNTTHLTKEETLQKILEKLP